MIKMKKVTLVICSHRFHLRFIRSNETATLLRQVATFNESHNSPTKTDDTLIPKKKISHRTFDDFLFNEKMIGKKNDKAST